MLRWNGATSTFWDLSAKGRELARQNEIPLNTPPLIAPFIGMQGARSSEFVAFGNRIAGSGTQFVGSKHFWLGDYTAHSTETFLATVRMVSTRTLTSEDVNSENMQGWHLADGALVLYQRGDEYLDIFPVWDWLKIPGNIMHLTILIIRHYCKARRR